MLGNTDRPSIFVKCKNDNVEENKVFMDNTYTFWNTDEDFYEDKCILEVWGVNMPEYYTLSYTLSLDDVKDVNFGVDIDLESVDYDAYTIEWGDWIYEDVIELIITRKYAWKWAYSQVYLEIYLKEDEKCRVKVSVQHLNDFENLPNALLIFANS